MIQIPGEEITGEWRHLRIFEPITGLHYGTQVLSPYHQEIRIWIPGIGWRTQSIVIKVNAPKGALQRARKRASQLRTKARNEGLVVL